MKLTSLKALLMAGGVIVGLSAFVHPAGNARTADGAAQPILQGANASPEVLAIVARSCQNCHSEKTSWPWYSYIAPMSWLVESDVSSARRHVNFSRWQAYNPAGKIERLSKVAPLVRNRVMPPERYLALHPEAKLSAADIDQLANWAHEERSRLRGGAAR